ncbi:hypothetical protein ACEN32_02600 [Marinilactibacillus psychrotolerans]|uniref:hypothetical protein n=1 Tax=Marinilactibacillus psychrotolerans TaxID=191770 RepID=UPI00388725C8
MAKRKVRVTKESKTGRNERFVDDTTGRSMTRTEFNKAINNGTYENYHTRNIGGKITPVSNPDKSKGNNLD